MPDRGPEILSHLAGILVHDSSQHPPLIPATGRGQREPMMQCAAVVPEINPEMRRGRWRASKHAEQEGREQRSVHESEHQLKHVHDVVEARRPISCDYAATTCQLMATSRPSWYASLAIIAAYGATRFNNIMDMLQLVFAFVNAPCSRPSCSHVLEARHGHGAFLGLISGTTAAALHHGLTLPRARSQELKWMAGTVVHQYPSEMAQNSGRDLAWCTCFVVTILISLLTKPAKKELVGLVYCSRSDRAKNTYPGISAGSSRLILL